MGAWGPARSRPGRRTVLVDVAGVAAPGHVEAPGGAIPGGAVDETDVRQPAPGPAVVVVPVVGGRPRVGAFGADSHLIALPVVLVEADVPGEAAEGRGVLVVEPVLEVEVPGPLAGAVEPATFGIGSGLRGAAVHGVHERDCRLAAVRSPHRARPRPVGAQLAPAGAKVDRQRRHPLLVDDLRRVGGEPCRELGTEGGDQPAGRAALGQVRGADQSGRDRLGEPSPRKPGRRRCEHRRKGQRNEQDERDPLDRGLSTLAARFAHAATLGAKVSPMARSG